MKNQKEILSQISKEIYGPSEFELWIDAFRSITIYFLKVIVFFGIGIVMLKWTGVLK